MLNASWGSYSVDLFDAVQALYGYSQAGYCFLCCSTSYITSTNEEILSSVMTISHPTYMYHGFSPYVINEKDFLWTYGTNEAFRIVMLKRGWCFQRLRGWGLLHQSKQWIVKTETEEVSERGFWLIKISTCMNFSFGKTKLKRF